MSKYIFLDTWVYSLLTNAEIERRLIAFVNDKHYTVLTTSLVLAELYNPNWKNVGDKDRMGKAARFLSQVPTVLVHPNRVYAAEVAQCFEPLSALPLELDLQDMPDSLRAETLLRFLRRDELFLSQGKDIQKWSDGYKHIKETWLGDVDHIIEQACRDGNLKREIDGRFIELAAHRDRFLFSLDFRHADPADVDNILVELAGRVGRPIRLTAIRLSSLCFWCAYVDVDETNRIKRQGSDIGDFYHLSLLPYCAAFTTDGAMHRLLQRICELIGPLPCPVMTRSMLESQLDSYA